MALLSFKKLPLPDSEETIAFRAIDKVLKHDIVLKSIVKTYNSYTGDPLDIITPTAAMTPYVQIAPKPMSGRWESEGQHRLPFAVLITCAVDGTNVDQLMNLFGCVRRALWPKDPAKMASVRAILAHAGITKGTLTMGGYGVIPVEKGSHVIGGQGHLELLLLVSTP